MPPLLFISPYTGTPENRMSIRELHGRLHQLECQGLCLAVREWFETRQDRDDPFVISFSASARENNLRALLNDLRYSGQNEDEIYSLADALDAFLLPTISDFLHELSDELKKIRWNPRQIDAIFSRMLNKHCGMDGEAYFRSVDACKADVTPADPSQPVKVLPGYLVASTELDLGMASVQVDWQMTLGCAQDIHEWIHTWGNLHGHLPFVKTIGRGLYEVQLDPGSEAANEPGAAQALANIFHPADPQTFARVKRLACEFFLECAHLAPGASMMLALERALENCNVPPDFLTYLNSQRELVALETQIAPGGTGPRGRI